MAGRVLVLGASGNFGSAAAAAFAAAGWQVDRYSRGTDMVQAARGADVVVNAQNPPNYHAWDRLIPEITETVIGVARATGATVLVPGNVYVFGDTPGTWGADTPHRPVSRKGKIRAGMEARYRAAADAGVRTILLRGGDFIDPARPGTLLRMLMLKKVAQGRLTALGRPDAVHAYAYLPDMAAAAAGVAAIRADLPAYADIGFPGYAVSATEIAGRLSALTGRDFRIDRFAWWQMRLAAPFWELAREFLEMRYLFDTDHTVDGRMLDRLLPDRPQTPLDTVLAAHLGRGQVGVFGKRAGPACPA